jgi:hypothetical protein
MDFCPCSPNNVFGYGCLQPLDFLAYDIAHHVSGLLLQLVLRSLLSMHNKHEVSGRTRTVKSKQQVY